MTTIARDGKPSTLPPIRDLAARVRDGEDLHDIATQYGFAYSSLTSRFSQAGFALTGEPQGRARSREMRSRLAARVLWPEWVDEAICAQTDPELFFPEKGGTGVRDARKVCGGCPVRGKCLDWALENNEPWGVFGGKTERERKRMQKASEKENAA